MKSRSPSTSLFLDCDYPNLLPCLAEIEDRLTAVVVADNVEVGARGCGTLDVRSRYRSKTEWFEIDLALGQSRRNGGHDYREARPLISARVLNAWPPRSPTIGCSTRSLRGVHPTISRGSNSSSRCGPDREAPSSTTAGPVVLELPKPAVLARRHGALNQPSSSLPKSKTSRPSASRSLPEHHGAQLPFCEAQLPTSFVPLGT